MAGWGGAQTDSVDPLASDSTIDPRPKLKLAAPTFEIFLFWHGLAVRVSHQATIKRGYAHHSRVQPLSTSLIYPLCNLTRWRFQERGQQFLPGTDIEVDELR